MPQSRLRLLHRWHSACTARETNTAVTHMPSVHVKEPELSDGPTVDENIRPALAGMQALLKEYEEVRCTCGVSSRARRLCAAACTNSGNALKCYPMFVHAPLSGMVERIHV